MKIKNYVLLFILMTLFIELQNFIIFDELIECIGINILYLSKVFEVMAFENRQNLHIKS